VDLDKSNWLDFFEFVCWSMLTYADVCWRMLTYADVCWRMLTFISRWIWTSQTRWTFSSSCTSASWWRRTARTTIWCALLCSVPYVVCVLILHVSSYYICVLILLYTTLLRSICILLYVYCYRWTLLCSVPYVVRVLILHMCPHTIHVSSYYYILLCSFHIMYTIIGEHYSAPFEM
jgi:hypothetical protein